MCCMAKIWIKSKYKKQKNGLEQFYYRGSSTAVVNISIIHVIPFILRSVLLRWLCFFVCFSWASTILHWDFIIFNKFDFWGIWSLHIIRLKFSSTIIWIKAPVDGQKFSITFWDMKLDLCDMLYRLQIYTWKPLVQRIWWPIEDYDSSLALKFCKVMWRDLCIC